LEQKLIYSKIILLFSIFLLLIISSYTMTESFSTSSNKGINWKEICELADAIISEPCHELIMSNNPYQLTKEGERVLLCIGGGALSIITGHLELLSLGPAVGCGSSGSSSNYEQRRYESNSNPLNDIIKNLLSN
jgi:hypothetical protein